MSTPNTPDDAAPRASNVSAWNTVFVDTKAPKKAAGKAVAAKPVNEIDIRNWSFADRQKLMSKGDRVKVYAGDKFIIEISKPLFQATSEVAGEILKNGEVKLPADTVKDGVIRLINHLETVAKFPQPLPMPKRMSMPASLSICAAAKLLGMEHYVDHIYKKCEALLCKDPPTYEDIDAIVAFSNQHERLFNIAVNDLAVRVWDETIEDHEDFIVYLAQNPILDNAIKAVNDRYATKLRIEAERKERRIRLEQERVQREEVRKFQNDIAKAKAAHDKAFWNDKKAKEAALKKSCQIKVKASNPKDRKFTVDERMHWLRTKGKQPLKGC